MKIMNEKIKTTGHLYSDLDLDLEERDDKKVHAEKIKSDHGHVYERKKTILRKRIIKIKNVPSSFFEEAQI